MYGYDAELQCPGGAPTSGDATKAKALLQQGMQEEGYSSIAQMPPIKFTLESGSPDLANEVTTAIGMWQHVLGVTVGTSIVDFNTLLTATANTTGKSPAQGGLQMWALGWIADYPDPQDWTTLQFGAGAPATTGTMATTTAPARPIKRPIRRRWPPLMPIPIPLLVPPPITR